MQTVSLILQIIAALLAGLILLAGIPLLFRFRWPAASLWMLKVVSSALSPILAGAALLLSLYGWFGKSYGIALPATAAFLLYAQHFFRVTGSRATQSGFPHPPPTGEERLLSIGRYGLKSRFGLWLPNVPESRWEKDRVFARVPENGRPLLCDIWQPPPTVPPSGKAFIYLHGSAFYILDKDLGTRTFFGHLAARGHVVMDVAYRLAPETGIMGMVHDVKRAVAWMKEQAKTYSIDPAAIILAGGSSGGHLALLAAYTGDDPEFCPPDLRGKDLSVSAVVSIYGTSDLKAIYYHTNQHITTREVAGRPKKKVPTRVPAWMVKWLGEDYHRLGLDKGLETVGAMAPLLGGHPDECPGEYALLSPVHHVHARCPPTLLIHGRHDIMAPVTSTLRLHRKLKNKGVPTVLHILPQTDHAFDLIFSKLAPAARVAIYDVDRFVEMAGSKGVLSLEQPKVLTGTH